MSADLRPVGALADAVDSGLPRRLSCRKGAACYDDKAQALSERVDIFLDGRLLEHASAWDVDGHFVERQRRHDDGRLILDRGAPTFEIVYGQVEIRWARGASK